MYLEKWYKLMQAFGLAENQDTYDKLINAYTKKQRHYHTFEHINACLKHLDEVVDLAEYPHEIELALWFHDAVYKPYAKDNELKSALWAQRFLYDNLVTTEIADRVFQLIMVTTNHGTTNTKDESLMIDIDLTILGTSSEVYNQYEKNVRKEYRFVPYFLYRKKRKEILQGFLNKPRLYQSNYFFDLFESQARMNLGKAILAL